MTETDVTRTLRDAIEQVMDIESVTLVGENSQTMQAQGRLRGPADEAFDMLRPLFEQVEHTPFLRREDGRDVVVAVNKVFNPEASSAWPNLILFVLTVISVLAVGVLNELDSPPVTVDKIVAALPAGALFMASLLGILGAHEMGHYLMARRYGVRVTLPYFIPLPSLLGTLGAVIAMKEPAPNRRVQFDIGVAGPLAGMVVALPVLIIGLLLSEVFTQQEIVALIPPGAALTQEGNSLLYLALKYVVFGKILPSPGGEDVFIHSIAFAGWAGLLVTGLNLMPVGQLDGGHVMYGLFGGRAKLALWPVIGAMLLLGLLYQGWWLWAALIFLMGRRNALVLDEITGLDSPRRWLAVGMLVMFVLIFVPVPIGLVALP